MCEITTEELTKIIENPSVSLTREALALAYNDRGHLRYKQVDFDEAVEDYTNAIELNQNLAVAFYNRGTIRYRLGEYEAARQDLTRAVSIEPSNEEFQEALRACAKFLSTRPNQTSNVSSGMQAPCETV